MNTKNTDLYPLHEVEPSFDYSKEFFKYLFFWKYFLISIFAFLICGFLINRYTPKLYENSAKIQILDKKQNNLEMPSAEDLFKSSKINLENEIEILKSSNILQEVIENLNLNLYVEGVGEIMTSRVLDYPFEIISKVNYDTISNMSFNLEIEDDNLLITQVSTQKKYVFSNLSTLDVVHSLPFEISNIVTNKWFDNSYNVNFVTNLDLITSFKEEIRVSKIGKNSDIINLIYRHSNIEYAKNVINEIINVFNQDGIRDRQLIHKRTIDFVNDRYKYLSSELESIELEKQSYKVSNNLVDLAANSSISLEKNLKSEEKLFSNENQIFLVTNLLNELNSLNFELLPSNIGIENIEVNALVASYNDLFLEKQKLNTSAGPNNPYFKQLKNSLTNVRENIIFSLTNYLSQLKILRDQLTNKSNIIQNKVASFPSQEKNLRAIERNQQIKEALYLFLLQKGEEAQVSFAVTEPSIKVVEYAISSQYPISPKTKIVYLIALLLGLLIPFIILYAIFLLDTKIHSRDDLDNANLNVVGEIPFFDLTESEKIFSNPNDRTIISESFRMLMSNVRYLQKNDTKSNVILVTSSIKGEGKTLNALNLALSFSSVGKKVLLIGCDLRNPQIHKYINYDKNVPGLVDFLVDNKTSWKKNIIKPFDSQSLNILLSGPIPPNPLNLINNGNIEILLKDARQTYDHIIIDSAPTLLVADTQSLINKSDILIFITRCNVTDNEVLSHIKKISDESYINLGVVLNGIGQKNSYGYSYGYRYGYGYNYKYSYNYGYGYGYSSDDEKS
ncbi:MAG: GumC family protein [Flavobacteriales bacterium]